MARALTRSLSLALTLGAAALVALPASADDEDDGPTYNDDRAPDDADEDEGEGPPPLDNDMLSAPSLDISDIMADIDLGPEGSNAATEMSYEGSVVQTAPNFAPGKKLTVTHYGGSVTVLCQDREGISATVSYTIYGTKEGPMERMGSGVGLSAWGNANGGGVTTRVPSRPSGVNSAEIPLTVNAPPEAQIVVKGGNGYVNVTNCKGTVATNNKKNGAYVKGDFSRVSVVSSSGDVEVLLEGDNVLSGSNKVSAAGGSAKLALPMSYGGKLYAKGSAVDVFHTVQGTNSDTLVQGTIGTGTASLSVTAKNEVTISAP